MFLGALLVSRKVGYKNDLPHKLIVSSDWLYFVKKNATVHSCITKNIELWAYFGIKKGKKVYKMN